MHALDPRQAQRTSVARSFAGSWEHYWDHYRERDTRSLGSTCFCNCWYPTPPSLCVSLRLLPPMHFAACLSRSPFLPPPLSRSLYCRVYPPRSLLDRTLFLPFSSSFSCCSGRLFSWYPTRSSANHLRILPRRSRRTRGGSRSSRACCYLYERQRYSGQSSRAGCKGVCRAQKRMWVVRDSRAACNREFLRCRNKVPGD